VPLDKANGVEADKPDHSLDNLWQFTLWYELAFSELDQVFSNASRQYNTITYRILVKMGCKGQLIIACEQNDSSYLPWIVGSVSVGDLVNVFGDNVMAFSEQINVEL